MCFYVFPVTEDLIRIRIDLMAKYWSNLSCYSFHCRCCFSMAVSCFATQKVIC